jgi:hypothetical protein
MIVSSNQYSDPIPSPEKTSVSHYLDLLQSSMGLRAGEGEKVLIREKVIFNLPFMINVGFCYNYSNPK